MKKINIINLGFNPWSSFWKRNQTIVAMLSLEKFVNKVLFLHTDVWLSDLIKDYKKALTEPHINYYKTIMPKRVNNKITAFSPIILPGAGKFKIVQKAGNILKESFIRKYARNPYILILNDPQAEQGMVDNLIKNSQLTIFDYSDDFVEFSSDPTERDICQNKCTKYCERSDIVFTVNEKLCKKAKVHNSNAFVIKNATNYFLFENNDNSLKIRRKIRNFGDKIVGYIGWLNSLRLDINLLIYSIKNNPEVQFIFMGPNSEPDPLGTEIPKFKNVHILPPVPYYEYPSYLSALDVCIIPNIVGPHTEGNDPIKLYDYLASGNPVVCTKTSGTEDFLDYIYCAEDKYQFSEFIRQAISENSDISKNKRIEVAKMHSWQIRFAYLSNIIQPHIDSLLQ